MLFLTRKMGQAIIINDNIEISVVEVIGKTVKLGFIFPDSESVMRKELYEKIKVETQSAAHDALEIASFLQSPSHGMDVHQHSILIDIPQNDERENDDSAD
jgi:carbon storage regulator CsrA